MVKRSGGKGFGSLNDYRTLHDAVISRSGYFPYFGQDGEVEFYDWQDPKEIHDPDYIAALQGISITPEHPPDWVGWQSINDAIGVVGTDLKPDFLDGVAVVRGTCILNTGKGQKLYDSGYREVSTGVGGQRLPTDRTYNGKPVFQRTALKPNHLALTEMGRSGSAIAFQDAFQDSVSDSVRSVLISDYSVIRDSVKYHVENPDQDTRMNELETLQGKYALLEAENKKLQDSAATIKSEARSEAFADAAQQFELVKLATDAGIELPEEVKRTDIPRLLDGVQVLVDAAVLGLTLDQEKVLEDPQTAMRQIVEDAMAGSGRKFSDAVIPEIYKFHVESKSTTTFSDGSSESVTTTVRSSDEEESTTTRMLDGTGDVVRLRAAVLTDSILNTANGSIDTMASVRGLRIKPSDLKKAKAARDAMRGNFDDMNQRMGA
jgi:hypothetical protein